MFKKKEQKVDEFAELERKRELRMVSEDLEMHLKLLKDPSHDGNVRVPLNLWEKVSYLFGIQEDQLVHTRLTESGQEYQNWSSTHEGIMVDKVFMNGEPHSMSLHFMGSERSTEYLTMLQHRSG